MGPTTPLEHAEPDAPVAHRLTPQRARAWWGDQLVADSVAAVRVEEPGQAPALYFPCADVRFELLVDEGHQVRCPVKGTARLWSITAHDGSDGFADGSTSEARSAIEGWHDASETSTDGSGPSGGHDVVWSFVEPAPAMSWLAGHAAFDHDRVRVELRDGRPGDEERDRTSLRFPTWGDASDLIDLLDVRPHGAGRYVSGVRSDWRRPVVEGSQMLGQALVAASRHCGGRRVVSAHMVFPRAVDSRRPLELAVEELSHGRTFTTLRVDVTQDGRRGATGTFLADETAPDVVRHAVAAPEVAGPYDSAPFDMSVTGRDLRIVDGAYTSDPDAPVGPPLIDTWVRFRDVPSDQALHAALLAQFTGHISIAAALRPHAGVGQLQAHRTLSTAINAIAISFHAEVAADQWMLYRHRSTFAGDGMTHSECRVHTEDGDLVASFTVDAMVRGFDTQTSAPDDRTAL